MATLLVPLPTVKVSAVYATILPEPLPVTAIAFPETVMPEVHGQEPAGITTVSPLAAELMAACTSLVEQEAAVRVAAYAGALKSALKRSPNRMPFMFLVIGRRPSLTKMYHSLRISGTAYLTLI